MTVAGTIAVSFGAAACATLALSSLAARVGWVDASSDAPDRKVQAAPVPPVGGPAIAIAIAITFWLDPASLEWLANDWTKAALAAAFALGLADDLAPRGLAPAPKLCGQFVAGVLFAVPWWHDGIGAVALAVLAAVTAQNALNTFDNADGAAAALAACGLVAGGPAAAAAVAGFLPFNLWIGGVRATSPSFTPRAYLGDSGSHMLGLALLASPLGWTALCLPLLDLARVSAIRVASGIPPWIGDRRHLAHRLQAAGLSRTTVVAALLAIAAPPIVAAASGGDGRVLGIAGLASAVALFAAVRATRAAS
jgi:UDP-GlcNAc:undecaprenyl-phosphate GlcNAc-1-phosphate transferase